MEPNKCILKKIQKMFILVFFLIFQSSMGQGKSRCDVPSGTTQAWACPIFNVQPKKKMQL